MAHFFGAYFHQDWDIDASNWRDVVANFARDGGAVVALQTASDLRSWLDETAVENYPLFPEFHCDYDPHADGLTDRDWVALIAIALVNEAMRATHTS